MALAPSFTIVQDNGGTTATATNTTVYGGAEQDRNEAAEYVLWSKTSKTGVRTFYNPSQGDVLTKLIYSVATAVSGLYELIWLRIQFYSSLTAYVAGDVVYYTTNGKVYIANASSTGQLPTDTNYFDEVTDLSTVIDNDTLEQLIVNFNSIYAINNCITSRLANSGCSCSSEDKSYNLSLFSDYLSAQSNYNSENIYEFEAIIERLNTACTTC